MKSNTQTTSIDEIYDEIYVRFFYNMPALSDFHAAALFNESYWVSFFFFLHFFILFSLFSISIMKLLFYINAILFYRLFFFNS